MGKIRVGILFGGRSAEHEVSLQSAKNIITSLDNAKYDPVLIGIGKDGKWYYNDDTSQMLLHEENPKLISLNKSNHSLAVVPGTANHQLLEVSENNIQHTIDVIFPVLHGPFGEDGTIQGLLKTVAIPFVGADVLGSAIGMDKDVMKRLLRDASLPIPDFITVTDTSVTFEEVKRKLGAPFFVKPANLGSSVGVKKVRNEDEMNIALSEAFMYDKKVMIEEYIEGREIECAVLGNDDPSASVAGEIVPKHEFYDYDAKYIDENGADLIIPAAISDGVLHEVQRLAILVFKVLCCEGMARVDFFLTKSNKLYINEINTIPGFTNISMYPKLWEASGIAQTELIDRLIQLAIERYAKEKQLKTSL